MLLFQMGEKTFVYAFRHSIQIRSESPSGFGENYAVASARGFMSLPLRVAQRFELVYVAAGGVPCQHHSLTYLHLSEAFLLEKKIKFLTRLPATYKECSRAIGQAVAADDWIRIGELNQTPATQKRPAAIYRAFETTVTLYDQAYRAVVIHSSAHDKRRHKRIDRLIEQKRKTLEAAMKKINPGVFFCRADAEAAVEKLHRAASGSYHGLQCQIRKVAKYPRGRSAKNKPRVPIGYDYVLQATIKFDDRTVAPLRLEAGCFVLICNIDDQEAWSAEALLKLYKNQTGIEQNFGFLKDPVIVNSIFLKKPHRIEVLGLVLLISLLIWRLMERCMRQYIKKTGTTITGWKKRPTKRPTPFMMTTKFISILVLKSGTQRQLAKPLRPVQLEFLRALDVRPDVFTVS